MNISKISIEVNGKNAEKEAGIIRAMLEKIPLEINGSAKARLTEENVLVIDSEWGIKNISNDIKKGEVMLRGMYILRDAHPILKFSLKYGDIAFNIITPVRMGNVL